MLIQRKNEHLTLSQHWYINDLLTKYPPAKRFKTPCTEGIFKPPLSELETPLINNTIYLSMLMQLIFLATRTRPDILTAVCALATKWTSCSWWSPSSEYKDLELHCKVTDLQLHAYFDAGWAWHWDTLVFQSCTRARSRKWSLGRRASLFVLLFVDLAFGYRRIGQFMGIPDTAPLPVHQDNTSSMKIATMGHGSSTSNTKFMDLKFQWLKQHIDSKITS